MDATDIAIGVVLMATLAWVSIIALNLGATQISIGDLYALSVLNRPLISPEEMCLQEPGFELVQPDTVEASPYHVSVGITDLNQTYFCFYRKNAVVPDSE